MKALAAALASLAVLTGCVSAPDPTACTGGAVQLLNGYSGSPDAPCTRLSSHTFLLEVIPEADPINPSPWYAFTLESRQQTEVTVTLRYATSRHRYRPWIRQGDDAWSRLEPSRVQVSDDERTAELALAVSRAFFEVAAQPPYLAEHYARLEARWPGDWRTIALSVEGRPIRARIAPPRHPEAGWILVLGRQHPPEIPGAWALEAFVDEIIARRGDQSLQSGVIVAPLLNPDGVERGFWRLNANGVDLNRDWADQTQPEVRAVYQLLDSLSIAPGDLSLMVDFHTTVADRIYLPQPGELPDLRNQSLEAWLGAMAADGLFATLEPRRTTPRRRVSAKAVFTDAWRTVAVTWEAGDETDEAVVRDNARRAAALWVQSQSAPRALASAE
jgi:hypothetical protein